MVVLYIYNYMDNIVEKLLNKVLLPRYPLIERIEVIRDDDFDYTTYKIYVITKTYEAIEDDYKIVKDINGLTKLVGVPRRDIENIIFSVDD